MPVQNLIINLSPVKQNLTEDTLRLMEQKNILLQISIIDNQMENRPVLVFIHGNSTCKEIFYKQFQYFSKTHRVISFDLLGHGQSTKLSTLGCLTVDEKITLAEQLYNLPAMINQSSQILAALDIKKAAIIGWSLGGHIAYGLAIANPELVSAVITNGTPPINFSLNGLHKGFSAWFMNHILKDWINNPRYYTRIEAEKIAENMGFIDVLANDSYIVDALMQTDPLFRRYLFHILNEINEFPELNIEHFIQVNETIPVCLLEGQIDKGINVNYIRACFNQYISSKHPNAYLFIFKGVEHAVFRNKTNSFNNKVASFLNNIKDNV